MQRLLIIDSDVAINIFEYLKKDSPLHYSRVIEQLALKCDKIWIPKEVELELVRCPNNKKIENKKRQAFNKILETHQFIRRCPIKVTRHEIDFDNGHSTQDRGETDAMIQSSKLISAIDKKFRFSEVHLFLKDKGAIKRAKFKNLEVLLYKDFANKLKEIGVILP